MKTSRIATAILFIAMAVDNFVYGQSVITDNKVKEKYIIYSINGPKVVADSIWKIHDNKLEYVASGSLHDFPFDKVRRIKRGLINYIIVADTLYPLYYNKPVRGREPPDTSWCYDPGMNYAALGTAHADMYVTETGGVFAGLLLAPTFVGPLIIASIPPRAPDHLVPNKTVYNNVPEYRKAYINQGQKIKKRGVLIGVGAFLLASATIALFWTSDL